MMCYVGSFGVVRLERESALKLHKPFVIGEILSMPGDSIDYELGVLEASNAKDLFSQYQTLYERKTDKRVTMLASVDQLIDWFPSLEQGTGNIPPDVCGRLRSKCAEWFSSEVVLNSAASISPLSSSSDSTNSAGRARSSAARGRGSTKVRGRGSNRARGSGRACEH